MPVRVGVLHMFISFIPTCMGKLMLALLSQSYLPNGEVKRPIHLLSWMRTIPTTHWWQENFALLTPGLMLL